MNAAESLQALRQALLETQVDAPATIEWVARIDSTQDALLRRGAMRGDVEVLIASRQDAGRGRRGRRWQGAEGGNLFLSLYRRFDPRRVPAGLTVALGVALAEALRAQGFAEVGLKWPNDLVARERKLGGLLVDVAGDGVVIGLGINRVLAPGAQASIDAPVIDLAALAPAPELPQLAARMLAALLGACDEFERTGLAPFVVRFAALDALAGRRVRVFAGSEHFDGEVAGIAADGALRLHSAGGERVFHSADVSLRAA